MKYQGRSIRKRTGGRLRGFRKKRKAELGREPAETEIADPRIRVIDTRGGTEKRRALATNRVSVSIDGETVPATIEDVVENPANPHYVRRNIVTRGAVVETSVGQARVTSRPGQTGEVKAVLIGERREPAEEVEAEDEEVEDEAEADEESGAEDETEEE